jgi:predicted restriction endonuclease
MAQDSVERLLGRMITDDAFRKAVKKDFKAVCFSEGFNLNASEMAILSKINFDKFSQLAKTIDDDIRREGRR